MTEDVYPKSSHEPMTEDRLAYIRENVKKGITCCSDLELLEYIDSLRCDVDLLRDQLDISSEVLKKLEEEVSNKLDVISHWVDEGLRLTEERDSFKFQMMEIKDAYDSLKAQVAISNREFMACKEERDKYRLALLKIDEPLKYHHWEEDPYTRAGCFQFVAHEALKEGDKNE